MEPTIVFAGVTGRHFPTFQRINVDAWMATFWQMRKDKRLLQYAREQQFGRSYLDSGVFTFLNKAGGIMHQRSKSGHTEQTWDAFKLYAREYIAYLRAHAHEWDHIVELDISPLFGVEVEDAFRSRLHAMIGDRLLPVWHGSRGMDGWREMIRKFPYVAFPLNKETGGKDRRMVPIMRQMIDEAHAVGTSVHILGVTTMAAFTTYGADTVDSSSWLMLEQYGNLKLEHGSIYLPKYEQNRGRVSISHGRVAQLEEICAEGGYTLQEVVYAAGEDRWKIWDLAVRLLLHREREIRNARKAAQKIGGRVRNRGEGPVTERSAAL